MRLPMVLAGFTAAVVTATPLAHAVPAHASAAVAITRVPDGGLQPQVAVERSGRIHLVYLTGDPAHSDIYYVRSDRGAFTHPIRVNSQPGSAMALGNMRGPHIALGPGGIVHVAWYGSADAKPRAPGNTTPMLYARLTTGASTFEPQRNVVQFATRLDGGAVAADEMGHVYVVWHGLGPAAQDEAGGRLWVASSADEGRTFARERPASDPAIGACGCCGVGAAVDRSGGLDLLYRTATAVLNRDTFFLASRDHGVTFSGTRLQAWHIGACPMSTFSLAPGADGVIAAWETAGRVQFATVSRQTNEVSAMVTAPVAAATQKYPSVAVDPQGRVLFAWTEGMAWQRGGDLVWQVYDANGHPTNERGRQPGVPAWSLVAAYVTADGGFRIVY